MLLSDVNRFFASHKRACLSDLVNHFHVDPQALKPMLAMLSAKGRIAQIKTDSNCGGCTKCDPNALIIYEWVGRD